MQQCGTQWYWLRLHWLLCDQPVSPIPGVRRCHSVLWALPSRVSEWSAALPARPPEYGSAQVTPLQRYSCCSRRRHPQRRRRRCRRCRQPTLSPHQQVHLSALPLALLWRFPQVPHIPLSLLHLRPSRPAHREVSPLCSPAIFLLIVSPEARVRKSQTLCL